MSKRDEQRKQADRDFEAIRQTIAGQSTQWLCDALREIPHRKWIEIAKDERVAVGILAHRAASRIAELERVLQIARDHIMERGKGSTHWEGCESAHPDCAILTGIDKTLGL